MASAIGSGKALISNIEKEYGGKKNGVLSYEKLALLLKTYNIDARYFFGQIEDPEDADLTRRKEQAKSPIEAIEAMTKEMEDLKHTLHPDTDLDPVTERVRINEELKNLVKPIIYLDGTVLRDLRLLIEGYLMGREDQKKRHPPGDNQDPPAVGGGRVNQHEYLCKILPFLLS